MERKEREALAADIALRVRTFAVHPLPDEFFEALNPNQDQQITLYGKSTSGQAWIRVRVDGVGSVVLEFFLNGNLIQRVRLDRASEHRELRNDLNG